jgi:ribosomal protein L7/L12
MEEASMSIFKKLKEFFRRSSLPEIEKVLNEELKEEFCPDCDTPVLECDCRPEWSVVLIRPGDKMVNTIKAIREVAGWGLKDSVRVANLSMSAPIVVQSDLTRNDAFYFVRLLSLAGAKSAITNDDYDTFMCQYLDEERGHEEGTV